MSKSNVTDSGFNISNCGSLTDDQFNIWTQFEFWCEGVFFSIVGGFGLLGNIFSIIVLASK